MELINKVIELGQDIEMHQYNIDKFGNMSGNLALWRKQLSTCKKEMKLIYEHNKNYLDEEANDNEELHDALNIGGLKR